MTENSANRPTEEFLRSINILTLLPQRPPFVMVGTVTSYGDDHITTETRVAPDNLFVNDGRFTASGLIENIAQTCAARIGYVNVYILKRGVQIGFIGAIRHFHLCGELPASGDLLTTRVDIHEEVFGMTLATATVSCEGRVVAETEIKIAVRDEESAA